MIVVISVFVSRETGNGASLPSASGKDLPLTPEMAAQEDLSSAALLLDRLLDFFERLHIHRGDELFEFFELLGDVRS